MKLFFDWAFWEIPYLGFTSIFMLLNEIGTVTYKRKFSGIFFPTSSKVFLGSMQNIFQITQYMNYMKFLILIILVLENLSLELP